MTDYKQLCSELIDELEGWVAYGDEVDIANTHLLIDRARAALAEPEPEGPTDEELRQLYCELFNLQCSPASLGTAPVRFACVVLARWGK